MRNAHHASVTDAFKAVAECMCVIQSRASELSRTSIINYKMAAEVTKAAAHIAKYFTHHHFSGITYPVIRNYLIFKDLLSI